MDQPSTTELIELMEAMTMLNQPLTPEEVEQMTRRRKEFMDQLSEAELAELTRRREETMRTLSPEQLTQMHQRRARSMPPAQ